MRVLGRFFEGDRLRFRAPLPHRMLWFIAPVLIFSTAGAVYVAEEWDAQGWFLLAVAAFFAAAGAAVGLRSWISGIEIRDDQLILTNPLWTWRIPLDDSVRFEWDAEIADYQPVLVSRKVIRWNARTVGLSVVWGKGEARRGRRKIPVEVFNKKTNPMADLNHAHEVWQKLQALTTRRNPTGSGL